MNIEPTQKVSNYIELQPIMASMRADSDKTPKNSLPEDTDGTIQSHAKSMPQVTLYNAHGLLTKTNANSLIGYA